MKTLISCLLAATMLAGCGAEEGIKRNDDRYLKPGALEVPLTNIYDTYRYKFLDKYRVTHKWPHTAGTCNYRKVNTDDVSGGRTFAVGDIHESDGKTWQRFEGSKPFDFSRYVRSVKIMNPVVYDKVTRELIPGASEEIEAGLQSMCFESWYVTSHSLVMRLHKRDQETWQQQWTRSNPKGKWSKQRVAENAWLVQEVPENELALRAPNAAGGWFQSWLLPVGDTGYTIALQLGASQESLQYPEAHARMKAAFHHLIESVKIEPLNAQLEAEQAELAKTARAAVRKDCEAMAKRSGPSQACKELLAHPAD